MSTKKRKRDNQEKISSDDSEQSKANKINKQGRKKKFQPKEQTVKYMAEVEEEMNSYKTIIELNENDFIPYSQDKLSEIPNQFDKSISQMIKIYIYKLNEKENKIANEKNFAKNFKKIVYTLNMNKNEFAFFTILIEKIIFDCKNGFDIFEHLFYLGTLTKQFLAEKFNNKIDERFKNWKNVYKIDDKMLEKITVKDMNNRSEELTLANCEYDPDKFLDYNQMVDDLLIKSRIYKDVKK
jgi:hypothetical protein